MTAKTASPAPLSLRAERRATRNGTDIIIVAAMAIGFLLTSLTSEGSQSQYYDLPGWLQALQPVARPGAMGFFLIALIRYFMIGGMFAFRYLVGPAWIAWIINLYLLIKIFILGGDVGFFSQAILLAVVQISLLLICVTGEHKRYGNPNQGSSLLSNFEASVFLFAGMFAALNLILLVVAPEAVSTWFGRFYGVTANPQHTMMICVLCIPACVLVLRTSNRPIYERAYALLALIGLGVVIFNTGSRTGFVGGLLVLGMCYLDRLTGKRAVATLYGGFMIFVITALVLGRQIWYSMFLTVEQQYVVGREDTRTHVWRREFNDFIENWQFGVPLEEHGRLYFAETYWISIPSNGGVIGLFLVLILLGLLLYTLQRLTRAGLKQDSPLRYRIYAAACLAILALSVVESILAGLIVAHTMLSTGFLAIAWNMKTPRQSIRLLPKVTPRPVQSYAARPQPLPVRADYKPLTP